MPERERLARVEKRQLDLDIEQRRFIAAAGRRFERVEKKLVELEARIGPEPPERDDG